MSKFQFERDVHKDLSKFCEHSHPFRVARALVAPSLGEEVDRNHFPSVGVKGVLPLGCLPSGGERGSHS